MPDAVERIPATSARGDDPRPFSRSTPSSQVVSPTLLKMLEGVLADLTYPAQPWQIIVAAEYYGADAHTATRLRRLPPASYPSLRHIAHAYTHATGPRPTLGSQQPDKS